MVGDNFLVRGYEDGKHFMTREKFYPTLFVPSKKKTKYKTLTGDHVESVAPGTVRECREFVKKYNDVENFDIYGNERYIYQYISFLRLDNFQSTHHILCYYHYIQTLLESHYHTSSSI